MRNTAAEQNDFIPRLRPVSDFETYEGSASDSEVDSSTPDTAVEQEADTEDDTELGASTLVDGESEVESESEMDFESEVKDEDDSEDESYDFAPNKDTAIELLREKARKIRRSAISDWLKDKHKAISKSDNADTLKDLFLTEQYGELTRIYLEEAREAGLVPKNQLVIPADAKERGKKERCPWKSCDTILFSNIQARRRHYMTHYPRSFFCPVCDARILREDSLKRHFKCKFKNCVYHPKAARYMLGRKPDGTVTRALDIEYFNLYFMGGMEDFDMPNEHFKLLARRERKLEKAAPAS